MRAFLILLLLLQSDPREEYKKRAADLKESDAEGHYKLGLWCEEQKLADEAKAEFEKTVAAKRDHEKARAKLGYTHLNGVWVSRKIREVIPKGVTFPAEEEIRKMRAKGSYYAKVIDVFWKPENWQIALAMIEDRTGLFDGTVDVKLLFLDLGKIPAEGEGRGGVGQIGIDMKNLSEYEKTIEDFNRMARMGGVVLIPPARTPAIITHELAHCFQGVGQPMWFLEGMATYCAQDGHFVFFFRYQKQKVLEVDAAVEHKYIYARGWAFFEYLEAKHGRAKVREFIALAVRDKMPARDAAVKVTGVEWDKLKKDERDWAAKWISSFKEKK